MLGRRWFIVLLSVILFISVTVAGHKSRRHSSIQHNYGRSRTANNQPSISPREIFDNVQKITAENCHNARREDQTIDIQLDYGRWRSPTNLALLLANVYTTKIQQSGGSLESFPDSSFFSFLQALVASGRPLVFGAAAFFEPGIFQRHSDQFQPYAFRKNGTITASNTAVVFDFRENEFYQKLAQSDWTGVREEDIVTTDGGVLTTLKVLSATFEDGVWTTPYFDCGGGFVWMVTYIAPIFNRDGNGRAEFVPGGYECVADNGCVLQGRDLEEANRRKLRKLLQRCRRYGYKSTNKGNRKNKGY